ncbi:hypothetical protein BDN70DRAFT_925900 [Pholiota conissans]|uniref:Uncharacterized protein n=1 Tax=Pholiota conissans TaxID=109636 RepID=A0A9P6CTD1_9AGAR|nr:hypothetical protein BDN70DRAFT_925900 [Pholiota conissans]
MSDMSSIEKTYISNILNASIFQALLMGIYTVVYFGTMYIYFTKYSFKRYLVPATVTIIYLCNVVECGIQWYSTKWQFIDNGDTRDTVFMALFTYPSRLVVPANVLNIVVLVLSDGLLIWRCFNVWNRSFRVISVPVFLAFAEGALLLSQTIGLAVIQNSPNYPSMVGKFNSVAATGFVIAACTTLVTTTLIAYRINSFLKLQEMSRRRFAHIVDIVVQSGLVYSMSIVLYAATVIMNAVTAGHVNTLQFEFENWVQTFAFYVSGISTTIMVARVAMLTDDTNLSTSVHLSGLQFGAQTTIHASSDRVSVDTPGFDNSMDRIPSAELEKVQVSKAESISIQNV